MSNFKINTSDTLKEIEKTKQKLTTYEETIDTYLSSNINVDSVWNDYNTTPFISTVKKDKSDFKEYSNSLSTYLGIITNFCDSLKLTIKTNFNIETLNNIEYDSDKIDFLINILDEVYKKLNENYLILDTMQIPIIFKYYFVLISYKNYFLSCKDEVLNLKNELKNIKKSIEDLIVKTRYKVNSFDVKNINTVVLNHNYKVSDMSLSRNLKNIDNKISVVNADSNKINVVLKDNPDKPLYQKTVFAVENNVQSDLTTKQSQVSLNEYQALNKQINYDLYDDKLDPNIKSISAVNQNIEQVNLTTQQPEVSLNQNQAIGNTQSIDLTNSNLNLEIKDNSVVNNDIETLNFQ